MTAVKWMVAMIACDRCHQRSGAQATSAIQARGAAHKLGWITISSHQRGGKITDVCTSCKEPGE